LLLDTHLFQATPIARCSSEVAPSARYWLPPCSLQCVRQRKPESANIYSVRG
jgi:hypothetical protein